MFYPWGATYSQNLTQMGILLGTTAIATQHKTLNNNNNKSYIVISSVLFQSWVDNQRLTQKKLNLPMFLKTALSKGCFYSSYFCLFDLFNRKLKEGSSQLSPKQDVVNGASVGFTAAMASYPLANYTQSLSNNSFIFPKMRNFTLANFKNKLMILGPRIGIPGALYGCYYAAIRNSNKE